MIIFKSHLGWGDILSINGYVRRLAEVYEDKVLVVCKLSNVKPVSELYRDNHNIIPLPIIGENEEAEIDVLLYLYYSRAKYIETKILDVDLNQEGKLWDEDFYKVLGVPYDIKYKYSKLPSINPSRHLVDSPYAFVQQEATRGWRINPKTNLPVLYNEDNKSFFHYVSIMENAAELHLMNGSFLCLAELLNLPRDGQKAYYYTLRGENNFRNKSKYSIFY